MQTNSMFLNPADAEYEQWATGDLEFECRRRDLVWAITPDTVVEWQRRKIMVEVLLLTQASQSRVA